MNKNHLEQAGICPVATTVDLINGKWKLLILRDLLNNDVMRYNELRRSVAGISQKMLTQSLKEMESDGIVHREVFPVVPPKVEYSLTQLGNSMKPIIEAMRNWGTNYIDNHN